MAFVDELKIYAQGGKGGDGVVRWRQEKFVPMGGPSGGNGGRGGHVYFEAIRDVAILEKYTHDTKFLASDGDAGRGKGQEGKFGEDLYIKLPVGSVITNIATGVQYELTKVGETILVLQGGQGGCGNEHFKASTNTTPYEWTPGKDGQAAEFFIELKLFADIGLIGFPNAGKSSLLNTLTNAKSKIGAYPFTTLDPHLGVFLEYVIADIPGIIEGAHEGKGLGIKFLKHVSRTKVLAHLVSFENELEKSGGMVEAYNTIRSEVSSYDISLASKPEIIILTKRDMVTDEMITDVVKQFKAIKKEVHVITLFDDADINTLKPALVKILQ